MRLYNAGRRTTFIGLDAVRKISYRTTRNEATRCNFCKNNCLRTFIDIKMTPADSPAAPAAVAVAAGGREHDSLRGRKQEPLGGREQQSVGGRAGQAAVPKPEHSKPLPVNFVSKVPKAGDERRLIISTCEKGSVEDVDQMRTIKSGVEAIKNANPNFVEIASKEAFRVRTIRRVADAPPRRLWTRAQRERAAALERRGGLRIGTDSAEAAR